MDLKNINLNIKKGEFVCVIGDVGSGKSNLLNAINGEMLHCPKELLEGKENSEFDQKFYDEFQQTLFDTKIKNAPIKIQGDSAFVEPKSWIRNQKLRDIILFGNQYNEERYNKVVKACQLESDISNLPAGDLTEIGEQGVNLSGG